MGNASISYQETSSEAVDAYPLQASIAIELSIQRGAIHSELYRDIADRFSAVL
jgi:hypothetical protein